MQPEYLKYWGLEKAPFSLTPDPDMLYLSKQHQEGLIRLQYAVISNKGGALLVSENAGDGKTSLLARLSRDLQKQYQGGCRVVFIDHPTLTANQMVLEITRQLGVGVSSTDKLTLINELRQFLLDCHSQGIKCVVILDEGQMLCHRPDLLQELRILLNFCVSDAFLLTFILSGQRPLDESLRKMPEFYQRLPVRFFLKNMDRNDTREMIRHRLHLAGNPGDREIFSEDGYTGIYNYSRGCPRIICSVADLALVIGHSRYSEQVDFVAVSQACSDMSRTDGGYHYFYFLKSFNERAGAEMTSEFSSTGAPQGVSACPNCGTGIKSGVNFCPECGKAQAVEPAVSPPEEKASTAPDTLSQEAEGREIKAPADQAADKKTDKPKKKRQAGKSSQVIQLELGQKKSRKKGRGADISPELQPPAIEDFPNTFSIDGDAAQAQPAAEFEAQPEDHIDDLPSLLDSAVLEGMTRCSDCDLLLGQEIEKCPNCGKPLKEPEAKAHHGQAVKSPVGREPGRDRQGEPEPAAGPGIPEERDSRRKSSGPLTDADKQAGVIRRLVCPHCGKAGRPAGPLCDFCGSPLESDSYEQVLLKSMEELSFGKYILSKSYSGKKRIPDPKNEELLSIPRGRFWEASAVLRCTDSVSGESFTTRCGLVFTGGKLRFDFSDGVRELPYENIETVTVEKLSKNSTVIVYQLVLSTAAGQYRISLPYRLTVARQMSELLKQYISAKAAAMAHAAACRRHKRLES